VATDIAARGIHVDDVALVVHADPPVEEKAYLHRSGRTARAGAEGTVITLMTDDQVRDVRALTRAAGIHPTITRIDRQRHPMLATLAPGERVLVPGGYADATVSEEPSGGGRTRNSGGRARQGGGRRPAKVGSTSGSSSSGAPRSTGASRSSGGSGQRRGSSSANPARPHSAASFSSRRG